MWERSWVWTQLSKKATVCGGNFSPQVIGRSILTTSEKWNGIVHIDKIQHRKEEHKGFSWKPLIGKITRRNSFTIILKLQKLQESRWCIQIGIRIESPSLLAEKVYLCLNELLGWRQMDTGEILETTHFHMLIYCYGRHHWCWFIGGNMLIELFDLELKSSKQREPQSGEDLEEVGYSMDFERELRCFLES